MAMIQNHQTTFSPPKKSLFRTFFDEFEFGHNFSYFTSGATADYLCEKRTKQASLFKEVIAQHSHFFYCVLVGTHPCLIKVEFFFYHGKIFGSWHFFTCLEKWLHHYPRLQFGNPRKKLSCTTLKLVWISSDVTCECLLRIRKLIECRFRSWHRFELSHSCVKHSGLDDKVISSLDHIELDIGLWLGVFQS